MNEKLIEARQLLAACGWRIEVRNDASKITYVVFDKAGVSRRSFVPTGRLWDYARGVFDAQEFNGGSK